MIQNSKNIISEEPIHQVWKRLRYFLEVSSVENIIRHNNNLKKSDQKENVKKQAKQIGYCIRQAEEYFLASSKIGLSTRPLLLYYGAVSLTKALVLLKKDGSHSIDFLRKKDKHQHHGLEKKFLFGNLKSANIETFFSSLSCLTYTHKKTVIRKKKKQEIEIPWGHFSLFYESLVPSVIVYKANIRDSGKSAYIESARLQTSADLLPAETMKSKKVNCFDLLKTLPDIYSECADHSIQTDLCRGNMKADLTNYYKNNANGNRVLDKVNEKYDFFLDGLNPNQKKEILAFYGKKSPDIKLTTEFPTNLHLSLNRSLKAGDKYPNFYFPDMIDDINGKKFYILKPEEYIPEPANLFILLYCLGMLSRYYPDIWMKIIDENVMVAEFTDTLLNIVHRKFPNLILDQMTETKHYIHS